MKPSRSARSSGAKRRAASSTAFWTPSITLLSILLLCSLTAAAGSPLREGYGWAEGTADAVYTLKAPAAPKPPDYQNVGFKQSVSGSPGDWTLHVEVRVSPLAVRAPFRRGPLPDVGIPPDLSAALSKALAPCRRADQAVDAVLLFLKQNLKYVEKAPDDEAPDAVFQRREASCVGLTRAACAIIGGLGIPCREVVGFKAAPGIGRAALLEGGRLHAWLEVDYPGSGSVFCDVLTSSGWVGPSYVVLRRGQGLGVGDLAGLKGGTLTCSRREDRIFFEPAAGVKCLLWARPPATAMVMGALLTGKYLTPEGAPMVGRATLRGQADSVSMDLWEGNFFFRDLEPGGYDLLLEPEGSPPEAKEIFLTSMDKRYLIIYSGNGGPKKAGAAHEPGRQP